MLKERPRAKALRMLREGIAAGRFKPGQPLPPERDLAASYRVSRNTLRWALGQLADERQIFSGGARTRMLAMPPAPAPAAALPGAVYVFSSLVPEQIHTTSAGWGSAVVEGAVRGLRSEGRTIVLPGHDASADELAAFQQSPPLGILLLEPALVGAAGPWTEAATALAARIPLVVFGEEPSTCDRVSSDHEVGAEALTAWLLARGRKRPICLWPDTPEMLWQRRRLAGYAKAMRAAGLQPLPVERVRWDADATLAEGFQDQVLRLAGHLAPLLFSAEPVDAILAISDGHVPAIQAALRRCRREPGRDIDVVGYDAYWEEVPERAFHDEPPSASVDKNNAGIGLAMAKLLGERIAGTLPPEPQERLIAPRLVPRAG